MNLFLLEWDLADCSRSHCDKHVVKMILEACQMMYTAWHMSPEGLPRNAPVCTSTGDPGYRRLSNPNHPMARWVRESSSNYAITATLAHFLSQEYTYRYKRTHACDEHVVWLMKNPPTFARSGATMIPQCMPEEYKVNGNPVEAYRRYYRGEKARFARWTSRDPPGWWNP